MLNQHNILKLGARSQPKELKNVEEKIPNCFVPFQNHFSRFKPDLNLLSSPPFKLVQIDSYIKRILSGHHILFYFDFQDIYQLQSLKVLKWKNKGIL